MYIHTLVLRYVSWQCAIADDFSRSNGISKIGKALVWAMPRPYVHGRTIWITGRDWKNLTKVSVGCGCFCQQLAMRGKFMLFWDVGQHTITPSHHPTTCFRWNIVFRVWKSLHSASTPTCCPAKEYYLMCCAASFQARRTKLWQCFGAKGSTVRYWS